MNKIDKSDIFSLVLLKDIFCSEWKYWLPAAILVFILASILMSGWPTGLIPNLTYPYTYLGDGLWSSWLAQRAGEGWVFNNLRSGYPFGSNSLDYPGSDMGSYLIFKILMWTTGSCSSTINLYFLLGFFVSFIISFIVLRALRLNLWYSIAAATLFVFLPFHFQRVVHLLYTWYFVVPIFFYIAFYLFYLSPEKVSTFRKLQNLFLWFIVFLILASFGVYYALFGAIILTTAGIAGWIKSKQTSNIWCTFVAIALLSFGVLLNITPNLVNKYVNGTNAAAVLRSPVDAETFGLKIMQLVLPRDEHRIKSLAHIRAKYNNSYPLVNENSTATMGIVGSLGFLFLGITLFVNLAGRKVDTRLTLLTLLVAVLFLFGTIGGLGALFSLFISPLIRGWNRISIFIAFGSIAAFFIVLQNFFERFPYIAKKKIFLITALLILLLGLLDQTVKYPQKNNEQIRTAYEMDKAFIRKIENSLPPSSSIYQLPYLPFPESPPLYRIDTYGFMVCFLHSKSLHWNYGGMKGREGDLFYHSLSQESVKKQLEVIKRLGFAGVYIDRRGFSDNAQKIIAEMTNLIGPPLLVRPDNNAVFFRISPLPNVDLTGLTSAQIMQKAGYVVDKLGPRYKSNFSSGIDFTKSNWPDFVRNVSGLSGPEPWGRWSDANLAPQVRFDFFYPLPKRFTLVLTGHPFGPNLDKDIIVKIGSQTYRIKMSAVNFKARLYVNLNGETVDSIIFLPPYPVSPLELGSSVGDNRKLSIGFVRVKFEY